MKNLSISILLFCLPIVTMAGAWNKDKGGGYSQFSYTFLAYNHLLNGHEKPTDLKRTVYDHTIQFYTEYGISKRFNLLLNIPYKIVSTSSTLREVENDPYVEDTLESGSLNGFSNLGIGGKFNIVNKKYVLSVQMYVYNKMYQYDPRTGLQIGYKAWLFTPSILIGKGWTRSFLQGEAGVQLNDGDYSNNFIGNFEYGYKVLDGKGIVMFRLDVKLPFTTGTRDERNAIQTGLYRDNSSYISPGLKLTRIIADHWFLNFGIYGALFSENEGAGATLNFAVAYDW